MCELFSVSSSDPVQVKYSLHAFAKYGWLIPPNESGWGIAYHEGKDALLIKESEPASDKSVGAFHRNPATDQHFHYSPSAMRDRRRAQPRKYPNPFTRELSGRMLLFAHHGELDGVLRQEDRAVR